MQNYHKLHLLDVNYGNDGPIRESKTTLKGEKLLDPYQTPVGKRGWREEDTIHFARCMLTLNLRS